MHDLTRRNRAQVFPNVRDERVDFIPSGGKHNEPLRKFLRAQIIELSKGLGAADGLGC